MTIQHASISDPDIHEPKGIAAALAGQVYAADGLGSGSWQPQAGAPTNTVLVQTASDFPAPVAGVITLADNTSYRIAGNVSIGTDRIAFGASSQLYGTNRFTDILTYAGTGTMLTATTSHAIMELGLDAPNGTVLAHVGTGVEYLVYTNSYVLSCQKVGSINNWGITSFRSFSVLSSLDGTDGRLHFLGNHSSFNMSNSLWTGFVAGSMFDLDTATFSRIQIETGNRFITVPGVVALNGAASNGNLPGSGRGIVSSNIFNGTGTAISGITVYDTKWEFLGNAGLPDTHADAAFSVTGNATETVISTINTPVQVDFDGNASAYLTHRFSIDADGVITYDGLDVVSVAVIFVVYNDVAAGTNKVLNYYIAKNGVVEPNSISTKSYDAGDPGQQTVQALADLNTGDTLSLWVENTTDTTNVTSETATCIVR
jgi:hypothetical protein